MLITIALGLFAMMFVLQVVGYRRGRAARPSQSAEAREGLGVVEGAVFALLGLLLAFLFGGAAGRLSDRRDAAVREANAVGTAYLRLDLLPPADTPGLREQFRRYVEKRIRAVEASDVAGAEREIRASEQLLQEIWRDALAVVQAQADREVELLLIPALNEMIDVSAERRAVAETHAAVPVQLFLAALALVGALLAGYSMSKSPRLPMLHMLLFAAVISTTVYCIFDMEYPRLGYIRIGAADRPMYDLAESMKP